MMIVLEIVAACPFGNVRTNAVGAPHDLFADRIPGKLVPAESDFPNLIYQFFSQIVNPKVFKICPAHNPQCY